MKNLLSLFFILILMVSCFFQSPVATTPEETDYLSKINAMPLIFRVPKEQAEDAWGRIQSWISRYASMKIQTVSDYAIETYNPEQSAIDYGYRASRAPMGEETEFTITCFCGNFLYGKQVKINAHILAYYALTGEIMEQFISR